MITDMPTVWTVYMENRMTTKHEAGLQTREKLLYAAMEHIRKVGMSAFTLDGVAKEAGVSKGGLLHHFPSKDALINGLILRLFSDFEARVTAYYEREIAAPGRWLRAYVRASFEEQPLLLELLFMFSLNDALMTLIRDDFARWNERLLNDGVPPARATIIRQAADSYWIERLVEPEIDPAFRDALREELLRMTEAG